MIELARKRGPRAVAASILGATLLGLYFLASPGDLTAFPPVYAIHAGVLALGFWFPAVKIRSAGEVVGSWRKLLPWLLGWTLVWDLATAGIVGGRELFQDWWIVYPSGVLLFGALLLLHGSAVGRRPRRAVEP